MTASDAERFNQAVALAQAGRKVEAHSILTELIRANQNDSNVLLWFAFTASDLKLARSALNRVAQLDPANPSLAGAESWLTEQEAQLPRIFTTPTPSPGQPPNSFATSSQNYTGNYQNNPQPNQPSSYTQFGQSYETYAQPQTYLPSNHPATLQPSASSQFYDTRPAKSNSGRAIMLAAVGAVLIVGVIFLLLFVTGVFNPDSIGAQGLPVYSGAVRIELSSEDRDKTFDAANQPIDSKGGKNFKFEMYSIKRSEKNKAIDFYDTEFKKLGWTATPLNNTTLSGGLSLNAYISDDHNKGVFVTTAPVALNNSQLPSLNGKLKSGDMLLLVYTVEAK